MKALLISIITLVFVGYETTLAQCYKESDLTVYEWITTECYATTDQFEASLDSLPPAMVSIAIVEDRHRMKFIDHMGNRHELDLLVKDPNYVNLAIFAPKSTRTLVEMRFHFGSLRLDHNAYRPQDPEYEYKQNAFKNWEVYWNSFSPRPLYGVHD